VTGRIGRISFAISFLLAVASDRVFAQENSTPLSPSEAYKAALAPFNAAKAQRDDLTDADKFALGIGMTQAARECLALSADPSAFASDAKELLALGQLCIFGQKYEPARAALVKYLALPQLPERKLALVLLVRALIGLGDPEQADVQVSTLLNDYPYDAQTHFVIDQVIDALESEGGNAKAPVPRAQLLPLCDTQKALTFPLLTSGKGLEGKEISASPSVLFADAIRCVALAAETGQPTAQDMMDQLAAIAQQPAWGGTAELAPMQAALARQQMVGARVPLTSLHGQMLGTNTLLPRTLVLTRGTVLLLPFTLWAPSTPDVVGDLAKFAPQQPIYAITSWSANTGREDVPSNEILSALRLWRQSLPPHVSMLIVPNAELSTFHIDSFPAGVAIRDGIVRSNSILSSQGAEHMLVRALGDGAKKQLP
jgi:hypothetical protein